MRVNGFLLIFTMMFSNLVLASDEARELFTKLCSRCHVSQGAPTSAPPIFAVVHHVKSAYPDREGFINRVADWIANPDANQALMAGAVKRFGLMPKLNFKQSEVRKVAEYMFDSKLKLPVWYKKHYKEKHGTEPSE